MRICPVCNQVLKDFDYFYCSECQNTLPQGLYKLPKPNLLNVRLRYEISPTVKFWIWEIPYEYKFSASVVSIIFMVIILLSIGMIINSYLKII